MLHECRSKQSLVKWDQGLPASHFNYHAPPSSWAEFLSTNICEISPEHVELPTYSKRAIRKSNMEQASYIRTCIRLWTLRTWCMGSSFQRLWGGGLGNLCSLQSSDGINIRLSNRLMFLGLVQMLTCFFVSREANDRDSLSHKQLHLYSIIGVETYSDSPSLTTFGESQGRSLTMKDKLAAFN